MTANKKKHPFKLGSYEFYFSYRLIGLFTREGWERDRDKSKRLLGPVGRRGYTVYFSTTLLHHSKAFLDMLIEAIQVLI